MTDKKEGLTPEELLNEFVDALIVAFRPNEEQRREIIHAKYQALVMMGYYDDHPRISEVRDINVTLFPNPTTMTLSGLMLCIFERGLQHERPECE
jgi:hypothetical protein